MAKTRTKQVWDREGIIAEIHRRGKTLTELAEDAGTYASACRLGIGGRSRPGAEIIAAFLDVPFEELFPNMYLRVRGRPRNFNRNESGRTSANRPAAADRTRSVA